MTELSDDDAKALLVAANSITGALMDVAQWLQPEAVAATSMTLAETVLAKVIAGAATMSDHSLDEIIERCHEHMTVLAKYYYLKLSEERV